MLQLRQMHSRLNAEHLKRKEVNPVKEKPKSSANSRDKADRRAGPRQGPYVSGGKLPRSRNDDGTWRKKRSDAGEKRTK